MKKILVILMTLMTLGLPLVSVIADIPGEFQIAGGEADKRNPIIRGDYVAWSELTDTTSALFVKNLVTGNLWQLVSGNPKQTYFQGKDYLDESGYVCWRDNDVIFGMKLEENAKPIALTNSEGWMPEGITGVPYITEVCMDDHHVYFCAVTAHPFAGYFAVDINNPKPFFIKSFANTKTTHKMSAEGGYLAFDCKDGQYGDIYLYNLLARRLTIIDNNATDQAYPIIQNDFVFYLNSKDPSMDVFSCMAKDLSLMCFNIITNQKYVLYDNPDGSYIPLQNPTSNYLILKLTNKYDVSYLAIDPVSKTTTGITSSSYYAELVSSGSASGDWVAINYYRVPPKAYENGVIPGHDLNVRAFHIKTGTTIQLCQDPHNQQYPMMSGDTVVWEDYRVSEKSPEVYGYKLP